nr:hypothetical protein DM860_007366 [Ipomoea batatas]
MAAADDSSLDLQRDVNIQAGNRLRLDEIRSKQIVVVKRSRKRSWSGVGDAGPSNAPASTVLAVPQVRKTWKKRKDYPSLRSRASTSQFFEALQGLNAAQTATIIEMGFASFPRGDLKIEKCSRAHSTDLLEEWKGLVVKSARGYLYSDVFYVDRVVVFTRDILRQIPSFVGWTAQLIKEREVVEIQAGGFGLSRVEDHFKLAAENIQEQAEECHRSVPEPARDDQPSVQPQAPLRSQSLFEEDDEAQKLDLLGKTIIEVIEFASKPPPYARDNEVIKLMHSAAQKLLGGGQVIVDSSIQKDVEASSSQDSFWCNP